MSLSVGMKIVLIEIVSVGGRKLHLLLAFKRLHQNHHHQSSSNCTQGYPQIISEESIYYHLGSSESQMTKISLDEETETAARTPEYEDVSKIPSLTSPVALRTLTYTRTKQLKKAALRPWNDPPPPPGLSDCCGSSCSPCVKDLWKEELLAWKERWGKNGIELDKGGRPIEEKSIEQQINDKTELFVNQREVRKEMPGAFLDW